MDQNFYSSEELDHMLAEMKVHQRRDVMLLIDEILTNLDSASPAADQWKSARKFVQLIEGKKFAAMAGVPAGAAHGESGRGAANDTGTITGFQPGLRMGLARGAANDIGTITGFQPVLRTGLARG